MIMTNTAAMGQQVPLPGASTQVQSAVGPQQMMPGVSMNPAIATQARQAQNDDIITRCLVHTQRLRENLEALLNTTKQAAMIESEDSLASSASSNAPGTTNPPSSNNSSSSSLNNSLKHTIDRKLLEMSQSLDQLGQSLEQYDFKLFLNQQNFINHYNELSLERQGTLLDEWSSNTKWMNKLLDLIPTMNSSVSSYRRTYNRHLNSLNRSRIDGPSYPTIERISVTIDQSTAANVAAQQQQGTSQAGLPSKEHSINLQRLSDHLILFEFSLMRSGLVVFLYLRHCTVEHVVVKPLNEKKQFGNAFNSKTPTSYHALKLISGHIRAAAVFYASSTPQPDQSLQKLLFYILKYNQLHSQKCCSCQKHLLNGLQPTWRDFRNYECYHEECLN